MVRIDFPIFRPKTYHGDDSLSCKEKIKNILSQIGVAEPLVNDFVSVLENCEFARYTPSSVKAMEQDYANTAKMITQIDKQL